jgi:hypothetical protein
MNRSSQSAGSTALRKLQVVAVSLMCLVVTGYSNAAAPDHVIYLTEPAGAKLFKSAKVKDQFWSLTRNFESEQIRTFCGVASSVIVLNALWDARKVVPPYSPYIASCLTFDQRNIFRTEPSKPVPRIMGSGMKLDQLKELLEQWGVTVEVYHADQSSAKDFRRRAVDALKTKDRFVIVNYDRATEHQEGRGHISPLAAYDLKSDRFLILDVARYKYPPSWAKADQLWDAMNTDDTEKPTQKRGFVIVSGGQRLLKVEDIDPSDCPIPDKIRAQFFGKQ